MSNAILQRLGIYRRAIGRCTGRLESTREFIVLAVLYSPIWKRFFYENIQSSIGSTSRCQRRLLGALRL